MSSLFQRYAKRAGYNDNQVDYFMQKSVPQGPPKPTISSNPQPQQPSYINKDTSQWTTGEAMDALQRSGTIPKANPAPTAPTTPPVIPTKTPQQNAADIRQMLINDALGNGNKVTQQDTQSLTPTVPPTPAITTPTTTPTSAPTPTVPQITPQVPPTPSVAPSVTPQANHTVNPASERVAAMIRSAQSKVAPTNDFVEGTPSQYQDLISQASQKYGIPTKLLSALLKQESGFNPTAQSPVGALGIAQFMPATASSLGFDPLDPNQAIPGSARYLSDFYSKYGDWNKALAAYNAGGGAVDQYGGVPPYPETQNYVSNIMNMAGY